MISSRNHPERTAELPRSRKRRITAHQIIDRLSRPPPEKYQQRSEGHDFRFMLHRGHFELLASHIFPGSSRPFRQQDIDFHGASAAVKDR
jgi:hypothetical protein